MERRDLELSTSVSPEQWDMLARTAQDLTPVDGYDWHANRRHEIGVYMRADNAPNEWRNWINAGDAYGAKERRVATFMWNDGDPFARIDMDPLPAAPSTLPQERMQRVLESWIHNRWQDLRRASGIPYIDAGHASQV